MTKVICVENISKSYRLGQIGTGTLTNDLRVWWAKKRGLPNPLLRIGEKDHGNRDTETLWALRNISLDVEQSEVLGIIGRNGAGKSTLLKILSRVTAPTSGQVKVRGRIASLLEVGTGFHPELTGRENIYLNGAILGMSKSEVRQKFDEIVEFAEVEKFVDTPVKRYSSGMYVRLAFAVAAHLEPEILIVDEVLAVGDAEFQKKCLGKMGDVSKEGRTVIFVSHNLSAVASLCGNSVLLERGQLINRGKTDFIIDLYTNKTKAHSEAVTTDFSETTHRSGSGLGRIQQVQLINKLKYVTNSFGIGEPIEVKINFSSQDFLNKFVVGIEIKRLDGFPLLNLRSDGQGKYYTFPANEAVKQISVLIPGLPLYPGNYLLEPWIAEAKGRRIDHIHDGIIINLQAKGELKSEAIIQNGRGCILLDCIWE